MWIMLPDSFLSIVFKDCDRGQVLVRARRKGDIERVFGRRVKVTRYTKSDYLYRAVVSKDDLKAALANEVDRITYPNFKSATAEHDLHDAYMGVWTEMARLQEVPPYSGMKLLPKPNQRQTGGLHFNGGSK
jgi:hypothetical protein